MYHENLWVHSDLRDSVIYWQWKPLHVMCFRALTTSSGLCWPSEWGQGPSHGAWWRGRSRPLPSGLQPCCCSPGCSWLPQLWGLTAASHQCSPHQSPNAISGKLFFIQPQPFLLHGAISSHGLVAAVVDFMRQIPASPFSATLSCCSPAMAMLPHLCRGHWAYGSFLSLSVVKSCVSNDWYWSLRDVAGGQPLLDLALFIAVLPAQQSLTRSGCWWQRVVILISFYMI